MKTRNRIYKKIFIIIGTSVAVASPLVALATVTSSNKKADGSFEKTSQYAEYSGDEYSHKELYYYLNHRSELWDLIEANYEDLSLQFENSEIANNWVNSIANKDITDLDYIIQSLSTLKIGEGLRLFILQNLFEKLDIYKFGHYATKSNNPTNRMVLDNKEMMYPGGESGAAASSDRVLSTNQLPSLSDRYEFYRVSVADAQPWDIGEAKGDFDHISGMYYSQKLSQLIQSGGKGWDSDEADTGWNAKRITFEFREIESSRIDSFNLLYNTARDTKNSNEDFTFVAIEPRDAEHITTDFKGQRVPSLFGMPVSFNETLLHYSYASQDNAYIISGHEVDNGDDNEGGNVLEGVPNAPVVNMLNARRSFNHIASDLVTGMKNKLNYNPNRSNNPLDENFLEVSSCVSTDSSTSEYLKSPNGSRIHRNGQDGTDEDYNAFAADITKFHWSNQTIFDEILKFTWPKFQTAITDVNESVSSIYGETQTQHISSSDFAQGVAGALQANAEDFNIANSYAIKYGLTPQATSGTWLGTALNILSIDYSSGESILDTAGSMLIMNSPVMIAKLTRWAFAGSAISGFTEALVPFVGWGMAATQILLSFFPSGNGHSIMSNVNDHGLNDWQSQWDTNQETMLDIAYSFSENYYDGITWKIVDSWTDLPELYIKSESDDDNQFIHLSPDNSFNYGNTIEYVAKHN